MQPRPRFDSLTPPPRLRPATAAAAVVLNGLLAAVLMIALTACASTDYATDDLVGTFEDGEGGTIALRSDGTGTLAGLDSEDREMPGTWELEEHGSAFVLFEYDETTDMKQIWISSVDELWVKAGSSIDGPRHTFERISDE